MKNMISASLVKELRELSGAGMMDCKKALEACNGDIESAKDWLREKGFAKAIKKESRIAAEGLANIYIDGDKAVILEVNSETDFVSKSDDFKELIEVVGKSILASDAKTVEEALALPCEGATVNDYIVAKTAKIGEKLSLRRFEILKKEAGEVFGGYLHMGGKIAVLAKLKGANEDVAKDVAMQAAAMRPEFIFESEISEDRIAKEKEVFINQAVEEGKPADIAEKMVEGRLRKFFKEITLVHQAFIKDGNVDVMTYVANNGGEIVRVVRYEVGEGMEKRNENFAEEVMNQVNGN